LYTAEGIQPFRAAVGLQNSLQGLLFRKLAHLAQQCVAVLVASNPPAGIAIDNHVLLCDEERLLEDSAAEFFERQKPLVCGREVLLEQAWMRLEGIRAAHHHSRDGLAAFIR
jgi:hypothetical protein